MILSGLRRLFAPLAVVFLLSGCMSQGTLMNRDDILRKPYQRWTQEECNIVMRGCMSTNYLNNYAPFNICVIPCTPKFLLAYNCSRWKRHLCSSVEFMENTDRQARNSFGGSFDGDKGIFYNGKGQYVLDVSKMDSLLILIDIQSATDIKKLAATMSQMPGAWLFLSSLSQDLASGMEHFQSEVSFRAGGSILAQPEYIHKSGITLLEEENEYAAMFYIGKDFKAYLRDHDSADLYFDFGGSSITIPVSFTF